MAELILYGLFAGIFSLAGGLFVIWRAEETKKFATLLIAFAAGAFLGVAFLDLLPEAVEAVEDTHPIFIATIVGFLIFFLLETLFLRFFRISENTADGQHTRSLPILVVLGDSLHNFIDGIVIALAYVANPVLALPTALAIAAHEIPQEIGDFAILLDRGWSKTKIIIVNLFSSLLSVAGVIVGYYTASLFEHWIAYLLAVAAGIFIYISASDLIPEIHHRSEDGKIKGIVFFFFAGLILVGYLVSLVH